MAKGKQKLKVTKLIQEKKNKICCYDKTIYKVKITKIYKIFIFPNIKRKMLLKEMSSIKKNKSQFFREKD